MRQFQSLVMDTISDETDCNYNDTVGRKPTINVPCIKRLTKERYETYRHTKSIKEHFSYTNP